MSSQYPRESSRRPRDPSQPPPPRPPHGSIGNYSTPGHYYPHPTQAPPGIPLGTSRIVPKVGEPLLPTSYGLGPSRALSQPLPGLRASGLTFDQREGKEPGVYPDSYYIPSGDHFGVQPRWDVHLPSAPSMSSSITPSHAPAPPASHTPPSLPSSSHVSPPPSSSSISLPSISESFSSAVKAPRVSQDSPGITSISPTPAPAPAKEARGGGKRSKSQESSTASTTCSPPGEEGADSTSLGQKRPRGPLALLTLEEKKANHIASEHKRRRSIRIGFDTLTEIVPNLHRCSRSEALILQKTVEHIHRLAERRDHLHSRVWKLRHELGEGSSVKDLTKDGS